MKPVVQKTVESDPKLEKEIEELKQEKDQIENSMLNLKEQYNEVINETNTLKFTLSEVSKEKSFYYSKLRDIEVLISKPSCYDKDQLLTHLKEILFSSKEMEVTFDEDGKVNLKQLN